RYWRTDFESAREPGIDQFSAGKIRRRPAASGRSPLPRLFEYRATGDPAVAVIQMEKMSRGLHGLRGLGILKSDCCPKIRVIRAIRGSFFPVDVPVGQSSILL